jgi:NADPH:quinone reductase
MTNPPDAGEPQGQRIRIREAGGPEVLELEAFHLPAPAPGELLVRVAASGVNRADLLDRRGGYESRDRSASPPLPGLEYAGTVEALGSGCHRRALGDGVMGILPSGGYASHVVVPESETIRIPKGVELVQAAAIPEVFMTAWDALILQGGLVAGESVLLHAVGSGVGTAAIQLARWVGASVVVGTARSPWKLEAASAIAPFQGVNTQDEDWVAQAEESLGPEGASVVLDLVGGGLAPGTQRLLGPKARWILVGVPSGRTAEIDLRRLMGLRARLIGTVLRTRKAEERGDLAQRFESEIIPLFESGQLRPVVHQILPAAEAGEAHRLLEANETLGKVLLHWS